MRIAVFIEVPPEATGPFQQSLSTIESLVRSSALSHEFMIFTPIEKTRETLLEHGIEAIVYRHGIFRLLDRWSSTTVGNAVLRRMRRLGLRRLGRHLDALLDDHAIDLVLLNECVESALRLGDHPFIVAVWDLDHRDNPDFPEAYADRLFERAERQIRPTLPRAVAVIANTPSGAERIASLYQVDRHRIVQLPFKPSLAVRRHAAGKGSATAEEVRKKYGLPARYVFYPSYSSFHKNHLYLLEALADLERRRSVVLSAVFCGGGYPEVLPIIRRQADALGLAGRVHFLGAVPEAEVPALYEAAMALVIPSYFGPTNLPPIEAAALGCPVICSDLPGCREQMGEAALYCNLREVASLADHLAALAEQPALLASLRTAGLRLAANLAKIDYGERLAPMLDEFDYLRRRWSWPRTSP